MASLNLNLTLQQLSWVFLNVSIFSGVEDYKFDIYV